MSATAPGTPRLVTAPDGAHLAVYDSGDPEATTIVAVHGYPDNHHVWDGVVAVLSERYRLVTYDVRGTGNSDKPEARGAYRIACLVEDLSTVLDAVNPARPVHLLAHDWGSVQAWPALTDPRFTTRIASFTSISGPSLDHAAAWLRAWHRHPQAAARQLLESYYIGLFLLPALPEAIWRSGQLDRLLARTGRSGRPSATAAHPPRRSDADKINGLQLYRANILPRLRHARPQHTDIPVQVLAPSRDRFVSVALQTEAPVPYASHLHARIIDGEHWVPSNRPDVVAGCTAEFVDHVDNGAPMPSTPIGRSAGG